MNATALLEDLTRQGFALEAKGDKLRIAPSDRVTPQIRDLLRAHKLELLAALAVGSPTPPTPTTTHPCSPWPAALDGVGPRTVGPLTTCTWCKTSTWVRYGTMPMCLACARTWPPPTDTPAGARAMLHALLTLWASMDEAQWTKDEVGILFDQIIHFWEEWPHLADTWFAEWRAAHPEARLA